eukprot:CAMPEP_0174243840 /NCGR_PEP_ID=MMETSP0417-20130205/33035_1 /TAXON_ID=242541 /ORGANISM="Mayorella sp, Strain BSH-02190019" /LENGTH=152 /DNA_ID=CAMNT_0015323425 /DNA_START=40 /DNA_END=495 /DNA_ORIENTATION=-
MNVPLMVRELVTTIERHHELSRYAVANALVNGGADRFDLAALSAALTQLSKTLIGRTLSEKVRTVLVASAISTLRDCTWECEDVVSANSQLAALRHLLPALEKWERGSTLEALLTWINNESFVLDDSDQVRSLLVRARTLCAECGRTEQHDL